MSQAKIFIPVTVHVKHWPSAKSWEVTDSFDMRTKAPLGSLSTYGFDESLEYLDQIMNGVLEALLENGEFDADKFYCVSVEVLENGRVIDSTSKIFAGNDLPEIPKN
jgi:hypothetical protein